MRDYALSDLTLSAPGLARLRHGVAAKSRLRFARRILEVGSEVALAAVMDRLRPLRGEIRRIDAGVVPSGSGRLALYLHWSPSGRVSEMVLRQLDAWRAEGFDIVFVSNATPPDDDWVALAERCVLRIERANIGRDFGAWRDALAIAAERLGTPRELLLANDSVLGPIRPIAPVVAALRSGGEGLFGLTESRGGGPHLQSYVLLARGDGAVAELGRHLAACVPSRSKWRLVQQGEIGLTRRMLQAGHRVAALFGHDRVGEALDARMLAAFGPRFAEPGAYDRYPLNPTHHLWRVLVEEFGFPYLKTELVLRNPGRLPGVEAWPEVVDGAALPLLQAHLALMRGG
ncbi:rhamnan synthesis F family protein [Falsiroseomonas sp. HW251]|uniref:rhamnan synthesis F family protein n=1 Tax=Falsiroseomonas sp. HW251 TaxID=3390998 RepID=UPI003D32311A